MPLSHDQKLIAANAQWRVRNARDEIMRAMRDVQPIYGDTGIPDVFNGVLRAMDNAIREMTIAESMRRRQQESARD